MCTSVCLCVCVWMYHRTWSGKVLGTRFPRGSVTGLHFTIIWGKSVNPSAQAPPPVNPSESESLGWGRQQRFLKLPK